MLVVLFWGLKAGHSCSLDVLYGGLGISKLQFLFLFLFSLNFWSSKRWIRIHLEVLDPDPYPQHWWKLTSGRKSLENSNWIWIHFHFFIFFHLKLLETANKIFCFRGSRWTDSTSPTAATATTACSAAPGGGAAVPLPGVPGRLPRPGPAGGARQDPQPAQQVPRLRPHFSQGTHPHTQMYILSGLRFHIHLIRIRIRIQHFGLNTDPDPIRIQGF